MVSTTASLGRLLLPASCLVVSLCIASDNVQAASDSEQARQILDATQVRGGLVVHIGCGDGKFLAALRANDGYLVHGLDTDIESVTNAREYLHSLGVYGSVSVE